MQDHQTSPHSGATYPVSLLPPTIFQSFTQRLKVLHYPDVFFTPHGTVHGI